MKDRDKTGYIIEVYEAKGPFGLFRGPKLETIGKPEIGSCLTVEEVLVAEKSAAVGYAMEGIRAKTLRVPVYKTD